MPRFRTQQKDAKCIGKRSSVDCSCIMNFLIRKREVLIFTVIDICIVLSNLGNTLLFTNSKRQIGLVGMLIGCGEITG